MKISHFPDPFAQVRDAQGAATIDDQGDPVTMILGLKAVRKCAHNWQTFQSGGEEIGRIVVPSEQAIRDIRQIPFEVDPPAHKEYRSLIEPWFKRPTQEDYQARLQLILDNLVDQLFSSASQQQTPIIDLVADFALVLQSRALTVLLNVPLAESDTWINWGTHVFRSEQSALDAKKANVLYDYLDQQIAQARQATSTASGSSSLYSLLVSSEIKGKPLTDEEIKGVMSLTFAGGRDTVINSITNILAYLGEHPQELARLAQTPEIIPKAVEEFIRYFSPLTHMGRVASQDSIIQTEVQTNNQAHTCPHAIKAQSRISLCWASANRDPRTFQEPEQIQLDRKLNPHVGFGFATHNCLGATHARQLLNQLLSTLARRISHIELHDYQENIEDWQQFQRKVGFHKLRARLHHK